MTLFLVIVAIGVVASVAVLVARDRPLLADDPVVASPLVWPPEGELSPDDLAGARFAVALRGYRMDEVDRVMADAQDALADRDRRIRELEGRALEGHRDLASPVPEGSSVSGQGAGEEVDPVADAAPLDQESTT